MTKENWEPTTRGGLRRTGVAQQESAAQIKREAGGSNPSPRTSKGSLG
jgi:hypothetical protein